MRVRRRTTRKRRRGKRERRRPVLAFLVGVLERLIARYKRRKTLFGFLKQGEIRVLCVVMCMRLKKKERTRGKVRKEKNTDTRAPRASTCREEEEELRERERERERARQNSAKRSEGGAASGPLFRNFTVRLREERKRKKEDADDNVNSLKEPPFVSPGWNDKAQTHATFAGQTRDRGAYAKKEDVDTSADEDVCTSSSSSSSFALQEKNIAKPTHTEPTADLYDELLVSLALSLSLYQSTYAQSGFLDLSAHANAVYNSRWPSCVVCCVGG